jgi:aldehyde dehydrogenase (NAD+)
MLAHDDQSTQDRLAEELKSMPEVIVHPAARAGVLEALEHAFASGAHDVLGRFDLDSSQRTGKMAPVMLEGVTADQPIAQADLFAPVISVIRYQRPEDVVDWVNDCPYRLAASVFGPRAQATRLAEQLSVGSVVVNDLIAPTADPRLPFGGRGSSGFGVTRGAEGLLSMTTPKVISVRKGKLLPHLQPRRPGDLSLLHGLLHFLHGGSLSSKWKAIQQMAGRNDDTSK